jgi:hypothetical protein
MIELACLESGGVHIALFWFREEARLTVFIVGSGEDKSFEVEPGACRRDGKEEHE